MKYKRLLQGVTILFFVVIAVLCFNFLFKITNVELSVTHIENSPENIKEKLSDYSKTLEGQNLLFVSEKDIEKDILEFSPYIKINSIEKIFPCSIKLNVTEHEEVFALKNGENYYMLDNSLTILSCKTQNVNNVTNKTNLLLEIDESDYQNLVIGNKLTFLDDTTNVYLTKLIPLITSFKDYFSKLDVNVLTGGVFNRNLTITTIEGMVVQFDNINVQTIEKFEYFKTWYTSIDTSKEGRFYITIDKISNQIVVRT